MNKWAQCSLPGPGVSSVTLWAGQACGLHVNFALIFSFCDYSFTFFLKTLLDQIYEIHTMERHAGHTDLPLPCRLLLPLTGPPSPSPGHYRSECVYTGESESEVAKSCPTLCGSMDCSPPGFSIHGVFQARILEWVAISFSRVPLL